MDMDKTTQIDEKSLTPTATTIPANRIKSYAESTPITEKYFASHLPSNGQHMVNGAKETNVVSISSIGNPAPDVINPSSQICNGDSNQKSNYNNQQADSYEFRAQDQSILLAHATANKERLIFTRPPVLNDDITKLSEDYNKLCIKLNIFKQNPHISLENECCLDHVQKLLLQVMDSTVAEYKHKHCQIDRVSPRNNASIYPSDVSWSFNGNMNEDAALAKALMESLTADRILDDKDSQILKFKNYLSRSDFRRTYDCYLQAKDKVELDEFLAGIPWRISCEYYYSGKLRWINTWVKIGWWKEFTREFSPQFKSGIWIGNNDHRADAAIARENFTRTVWSGKGAGMILKLIQQGVRTNVASIILDLPKLDLDLTQSISKNQVPLDVIRVNLPANDYFLDSPPSTLKVLRPEPFLSAEDMSDMSKVMLKVGGESVVIFPIAAAFTSTKCAKPVITPVDVEIGSLDPLPPSKIEEGYQLVWQNKEYHLYKPNGFGDKFLSYDRMDNQAFFD